MARFTLPRDIYHGEGALEALKSFTGKKAMICVGGGSMKQFGFLDKVEAYLKEAGMEVKLFEGIEPDPSVETVMRGAEEMLKFEPDWIVAMEDLRSMQRRLCGSNTNIRISHSKICVRCLVFLHFVRKLISVRFLPLRALQQK